MQTYINDTYHWKLELLKLLGVQPPTALVSACKLENETRVKIHDKQQTDAYKRNRYKLKGKRLAVTSSARCSLRSTRRICSSTCLPARCCSM